MNSSVVTCSRCGTKNRLPVGEWPGEPTCGNCGAPLTLMAVAAPKMGKRFAPKSTFLTAALMVGGVLAVALAAWLFRAPLFGSPSITGPGWQYARWGMIPEEVVRASGGLAYLHADQNSHNTRQAHLVTAPHVALNVEFVAEFGFARTTNELSSVTLVPRRDADCLFLPEKLYSIYGEPRAREGPVSGWYWMEWRDEPSRNDVLFLGEGASCSIGYVPTPVPGQGL